MTPAPGIDSQYGTLRILDAGLCTLLVDFGRSKFRSLGVPLGGAADRSALVLGNALVGNPPNTPALEISLAGPSLQADCELACVVYGAPFTMRRSAREPGAFTAGTTFTLAAGEELHLGSTHTGARAYFCVRGGLGNQAILGSHSGLEALQQGAELRCLPGRIGPRFIRPELDWNREPHILRAVAGPQADCFRAEEFYGQAYRVTPASNRMGLRLQGEPLTLSPRELASEPVCPGSVQVTSDGQCIILGVDGQTIGGYPKPAQVISADLDKVGQLRPGTQIRFVQVALDEAEMIYRAKQAEIQDWVSRLQITLGG